MATLTLADGDQIIELHTGNTSYAQYVIYRQEEPMKVLLHNTDYYSGNGTFTLHNLRTCAGSALEAFQGAGKRTYDALLRRGMGSEPPIIAIFGLRMHRDGVHRVQQGAGRLVCTLVVFRASLVGGCCGLNERSIRRSLPPPGPFFRVKGTRHLQATCNSTQARGKFTGV